MMRCNDASNRQQQTDGRTNRQVNNLGDVGIKTSMTTVLIPCLITIKYINLVFT